MRKIGLLKQQVDVYEFLEEYGIEADQTANVAATVFEAELSDLEIEMLSDDSRVIAFEDPQIPVKDAAPVIETGAVWPSARLSDAVTDDRSSLFQYARDGAGVTIYVVDGGIEVTHPQFSEAMIRLGEGVAQPSIIDDHATKIAGVIAGKRYGIAKRATLVDCDYAGTVAALASTCDWIIADHQSHGGPSIITCSMRWTTQSSIIDTAATNCIAAGIQWLNSAGNDNTDTSAQSPINVADVVVVGGLGFFNTKYVDSSYGSHVDIWAPYNTWQLPVPNSTGFLTTNDSWGELAGEGYMLGAAGTSYSTPAVACIAAMILQEQPTLTPAQLRDVLLNQWAIKDVITGIPVGGGANVMANLGSAKTQGKIHSKWSPTSTPFRSFGTGKIPATSAVWSSSGSPKKSGSGGVV